MQTVASDLPSVCALPIFWTKGETSEVAVAAFFSSIMLGAIACIGAGAGAGGVITDSTGSGLAGHTCASTSGFNLSLPHSVPVLVRAINWNESRKPIVLMYGLPSGATVIVW